MNRVIWAVKDAIWFRQTEWGRLYIHNWVFDLFGTVTSGFCTGKSLSEALLFSASTNPQYDDRLFIELQVLIHENFKIKPAPH